LSLENNVIPWCQTHVAQIVHGQQTLVMMVMHAPLKMFVMVLEIALEIINVDNQLNVLTLLATGMLEIVAFCLFLMVLVVEPLNHLICALKDASVDIALI
jgi:hypothetical protein